MINKIRLDRFLWLLVSALFVLPLSAQTLRIMTFNVRYPSPDDGPNRWELRRDLLVGTIRDKSPDLIGTQELFFEQGQYIVEKLPEFAWFGISRRGSMPWILWNLPVGVRPRKAEWAGGGYPRPLTDPDVIVIGDTAGVCPSKPVSRC